MSRASQFKFRLFVADHTQNSAQAVANLRRLCKDHLAGRHSIEIVDVLREPERALAAGVFMTPTLLKVAPTPDVRIVGTLSETPTVLLALGLEDRVA
ncbi:MAG: circadian clock KaiB family protein [Pseudomonadota bacterium]